MASQSASSEKPSDELIRQLLAALDVLSGGVHPGFRAVHAKGVMCSGTFTPTLGVTELTNAPHVLRATTPVVVRFSDFAGVPNVADNDPIASGPRGMAVRFYLGEHEHTDIIAHSTDGFPVSTGEEFLEFARALAASGPDAAHATPIEKFAAAHPRTRQFLETPKPIPTSFAHESFFSVAPYCFTNATGKRQFGRYRLRPVAGNKYLSEADAKAQSDRFLMDELAARLAREKVEFRIVVQLAQPGDETANAAVPWPINRPELEFGILTLDKPLDHEAPELRKIIFDPIPRVAGIDASDDPLLEVRAAIYLLSGRRRRAAQAP